MKEEKAKQIIYAIERVTKEIKEENPGYRSRLDLYQESLIREDCVIVSLDVLHNFFNSKSDANKYLEASEQEDLEAEFYDYLLTSPI